MKQSFLSLLHFEGEQKVSSTNADRCTCAFVSTCVQQNPDGWEGLLFIQASSEEISIFAWSQTSINSVASDRLLCVS